MQPTLPLRSAVICALLFAIAAACSEATEPVQPPEPTVAAIPTSIEALTPLISSATVGTAVDPSPSIRVKDQYGSPMRGVAVSFLVSRGNVSATWGGVSPTSTTTNDLGIASAGVWTLGTVARRNELEVRVHGLPAMLFTATSTAGPPARITLWGGHDQRGLAGETLAEPLRVWIRDVFGNTTSRVTTIFTVVGGAGTIAGEPSVSDATGIAASGLWTLGAAGEQRVLAKAGALEVVFTAQLLPPTCSPAASCGVTGRLAFSRRSGLYAANVDGTGLLQLSDAGSNATWSPDGSRIAFVKVSDGANEIYIVNADGSNLVRRTNDRGYKSEPAWSPDGRTILYTNFAGSSQTGIYSITADGVQAPLLIFTAGAQYAHSPAWSPDGNKIAFIHGGHLSLINSDGTGLTRIASSSTDAFRYRPAWAPDGKRIAVTESSDCDWDEWCAESIRLVEVTGGASTVLIRGSRAQQVSHPSWSPDGATIAFTDRRCETAFCGESIAFIKVDGSHQGVIVSDGSAAAWRR